MITPSLVLTIIQIGLFFAALLVGYFVGVHATRPTDIDGQALKRLLERYETAVIAYYADPSPQTEDALKEARAKLAWWRINA